VYDTSTQIVLEDGEDLELGGVEYDGWRVNWKKYAHPCNYTGADWDCDISEYENVNYDVLKQIDVTLTEDKKGVNALGVDESLNFPSQFMLTFKGYMTGNYRDAPCSGEGEGNIVLERGSDVYQMLLSFTGEDGNRYDDVRLDEGPFSKGDTFILDGNVWEYSKYKKNSGAEDKDDTVDITRKPLISGSKVKRTLYRFCDPEGTGISSLTDCNLTAQLADPDKDPTCNCTGLPEIEIRKIALVDAMDDTDPSKYERDENITLDPKDMFWGLDSEGSFKDKVLWFDESSNTIVYDEDKMLTVNPDMVGTIDKFETDNYLTMKVMRECDFLNDVNANNTMNESCDWNGDADAGSYTMNDDDLLVIFHSRDEDDEYAVIDLTDRGYDEGKEWKYDNSVGLYTGFSENRTTNLANRIANVDEDIDTLLIAPFSGDEYTIDWGVDNKIDSVTLCHPQKNVDATYFLGIGEETTFVEDTITKDDEGKEITAGCCTFKVKEFSVTVAGAEEQEYTTATVNKIIGHLVVPEVGADTTKNLIIVGGPAVNGMCTVTKDEIAAEPDKFIVKKDGNLLIVAGWEYEETLAAGDALIDWLNENIHTSE